MHRWVRCLRRSTTNFQYQQSSVKLKLKGHHCAGGYHTVEYDLERLLTDWRDISELAWRPCRRLGDFSEGAEERNW